MRRLALQRQFEWVDLARHRLVIIINHDEAAALSPQRVLDHNLLLPSQKLALFPISQGLLACDGQF